MPRIEPRADSPSERVAIYRLWDNDKRVNRYTDFFGAASRVSRTLTAEFLFGVFGNRDVRVWFDTFGDNLYNFNVQQRLALLRGSLPGVTDAASRDAANAAMVRMEQQFLQDALTELRGSDPDLYARVVSTGRNLTGAAATLGQLTAYDLFRKQEGRPPDFGNLEDRIKLGLLVVDIEIKADRLRENPPPPITSTNPYTGIRYFVQPSGPQRIPAIVVEGLGRTTPGPDEIVVPGRQIFISLDGGANWQNLSGDPLAAPAVEYARYQAVLVADETGVHTEIAIPLTASEEASPRADIERRLNRSLTGNSFLSSIPFGQLGSVFGSNLSRLIDVENPLAALAVGTTIGVIGLNLGQQIERAFDGPASLTVAFKDLHKDLGAAGVGALGRRTRRLDGCLSRRDSQRAAI